MKIFLGMKIRLPKILLHVSDHFTIENPIVNAWHFHQRIRDGKWYGFGLKSEHPSKFFIHL